ncbi:MAG: InlB B-repeat-containing protein, partial [Parasporobacterium sp.]|nr:InlB B-repeat-containing protein [Parasporobacterium sp.]
KTATFTKGDTIATITVHKIKFLDTNDNPISAQGGGTIADITGILYGSKNVTAPADPVLPAGQSFGGWYLDKAFTNKFVFGTTEVKDNLKLYANIGHLITYNGNGGIFAENGTETLVKAAADSQPVSAPVISKTHYTLEGWYKDTGLTQKFTDADFAAGITAPLTLYAKWAENDYINLTFMLNGGEFVSGDNPQSDRVTKAYVGEAPVPEQAVYKTARGKKLEGWYMVNASGQYINESGNVVSESNKVAFDFTKVITDKSVGDKYVKAVWTDEITYTVTLNADGGAFPGGAGTETISVFKGENLEDLKNAGHITIPVPTKANVGFMGWKKTNGSDYVLNTPINDNLTLVAKYGTVNITFAAVKDITGFTPVTSTIPYGGTIADVSPMPTLAHYNLTWYKDASFSVPMDNNPIIDNMTLYGTGAQRVTSGIVGVVKVECSKSGTRYALSYSAQYINFTSSIVPIAANLSSYNVTNLRSRDFDNNKYERTISVAGTNFTVTWDGGASAGTKYYWIVNGCTVNSSGNKVTGNDASANVTFTVSPDTDSYSISVP